MVPSAVADWLTAQTERWGLGQAGGKGSKDEGKQTDEKTECFIRIGLILIVLLALGQTLRVRRQEVSASFSFWKYFFPLSHLKWYHATVKFVRFHC